MPCERECLCPNSWNSYWPWCCWSHPMPPRPTCTCITGMLAGWPVCMPISMCGGVARRWPALPPQGIAVYGRDPVLTCGYTLFLSKAQGCPYLDCYMDGLANPPEQIDNQTHIVHEMKQPDWRNCSADAYHP
mmetsp:Transcript_9877/g.21452  ORF Transcript_9877/g.21452 Transcript_9877/m.21452 type:complete len:132 (-) Transcript_9877:1991-2386(-)